MIQNLGTLSLELAVLLTQFQQVSKINANTLAFLIREKYSEIKGVGDVLIEQRLVVDKGALPH